MVYLHTFQALRLRSLFSAGLFLMALFLGTSVPFLGRFVGDSEPLPQGPSGSPSELLLAVLGCSSALAQEAPGLAFVEREDVDLDGDRSPDYLSVVCYGKPSEYPEYLGFVVAVNGMTVEGSGNHLDGKVEIVDVDSTDRFKEIAIPESGSAGNYGVYVLRYDGRAVKILGYVPGPLYRSGGVVFDGSGVVKGSCRGRILDKGAFRCDFKLGDGGQLVPIPKDLYDMNRSVRLKVDLPIQKSRSDTTTVAVLHEGESAIVLQTDNEKWCLIEGKDGTRGWFEVKEHDVVRGREARDVFDGLVSAD